METLLTEQGFKKLREELKHIETVKIEETEKRVRKAIDSGNSDEIEDAKKERQFYEDRIVYLNHTLKTAKRIG